MCETIRIDRIVNGFVTNTKWAYNSESTVYHKDLEEVFDYLNKCFVHK